MAVRVRDARGKVHSGTVLAQVGWRTVEVAVKAAAGLEVLVVDVSAIEPAVVRGAASESAERRSSRAGRPTGRLALQTAHARRQRCDG